MKQILDNVLWFPLQPVFLSFQTGSMSVLWNFLVAGRAVWLFPANGCHFQIEAFKGHVRDSSALCLVAPYPNLLAKMVALKMEMHSPGLGETCVLYELFGDLTYDVRQKWSFVYLSQWDIVFLCFCSIIYPVLTG